MRPHLGDIAPDFTAETTHGRMLQLTADYSVATPANWTLGDDVVIPPTVSDEAAWEIFPWGWRASKPYMRYVACPR